MHRRRPVKPHQREGDRGFPAAAFAGEAHRSRRGDVEIEAVDGGEQPARRHVIDLEATNLDQRLASSGASGAGGDALPVERLLRRRRGVRRRPAS